MPHDPKSHVQSLEWRSFGVRIVVTGSLAYDYIMNFPGHFKDHILPDKVHMLTVSFLVESMRRMRGGVAGNIAYTLALLGERPLLVASALPIPRSPHGFSSARARWRVTSPACCASSTSTLARRRQWSRRSSASSSLAFPQVSHVELWTRTASANWRERGPRPLMRPHGTNMGRRSRPGLYGIFFVPFHYKPRERGSSASRNPSPRRLKPRTARAMATPGTMAAQGASCRKP